MKFATLTSAVVAALSTVTSLVAVPVLVPDGDFSMEDIGLWDEGGDPNTTFSYPDTGGNPGSFGIMENDGGGFGVLIAAVGVFEADNGRIPLSELGLEPGMQYDFFLDMILLEGDNIGGLKMEFYRDGEAAAVLVTPDMFGPIVGDGRSWATYTYSVAVPEDVDSAIFVPLWGPSSMVGYDNVGVNNEGTIPEPPTVLPPLPNEGFETPDGDSWNFFQDLSDGDAHTVSYPATGGNPDGHAVIDASAGGGFAGLVANSGIPADYDNFEAPSGSTIRFNMDMKLFSGDNLGQMKVEWIFTGGGAGSSPDTAATPVEEGTDPAEWGSYQFDFDIPDGVGQITIVPLWGPSSIVGYDNVTYGGVVERTTPRDPIPNFDFETPEGASWLFFQTANEGSEPYTVEYPATGGNPGGHAIIDGSNRDGFAGIVSNNGGFIPLERFGLEPFSENIFSMDMRLISGIEVGMLKVEFQYEPGEEVGRELDTGDLRTEEGDFSSDWATYTYQVDIPEGVIGIKIIPLWFPGSIVGYDNIRASAPVEVVPPLALSITEGTAVSWVPQADRIYQPQESQDGTAYINLGPASSGTSVNTTFDPTPAPFYRVIELDGLPDSPDVFLDASTSPGAQLQYRTIDGLSYQLETSSDMLEFTPEGDASIGTSGIQTRIELIDGDRKFFRISESE